MRALTVTLNAALDVTYRVGAVEPGATHRVSDVAVRAGGKGVNVARVLHGLGVSVVATGLVGGAAGAALCDDLARAGMAAAMFPIAGETRRTVAVVGEAGEATLFAEPGPVVTEEEWAGFVRHFAGLEADVVVLSGSLPQGLPGDAYATLVRASRAPVVLDADGPALAAGAAAGPAVITPNRGELAAALAVSESAASALDTSSRPESAASALLASSRPESAAASALATSHPRPAPASSTADDPRVLGAEAALVSDGANGMTAYTPDGVWTAAPPEVLRGNPTGAGDAAVAALVATWHLPWPRRLAEAVALSAAAVRAPLAGDFDRSFYDQHRAVIVPRRV
ncbi:hexose kinase [Lentzea sp. NBRC 102530]|uniref:1-phosphofructokinase family hexose kinase n=1 Tax=Lentzea sp. NBRC 102530 TaxID=3032201 RepID=UPI0024A4897B|nr:hexose kinase [Lentzea sp. NBRC 102530]GLY50653.1 sugar kinase [Lentzea sp. NBRC 102530]